MNSFCRLLKYTQCSNEWRGLQKAPETNLLFCTGIFLVHFVKKQFDKGNNAFLQVFWLWFGFGLVACMCFFSFVCSGFIFIFFDTSGSQLFWLNYSTLFQSSFKPSHDLRWTIEQKTVSEVNIKHIIWWQKQNIQSKDYPYVAACNIDQLENV